MPSSTAEGLHFARRQRYAYVEMFWPGRDKAFSPYRQLLSSSGSGQRTSLSRAQHCASSLQHKIALRDAEAASTRSPLVLPHFPELLGASRLTHRLPLLRIDRSSRHAPDCAACAYMQRVPILFLPYVGSAIPHTHYADSISS
jgi:hypothetical protein